MHQLPLQRLDPPMPLLTAPLLWASALAEEDSSMSRMEGEAGLSWGSRKAGKDAVVVALTPTPPP